MLILHLEITLCFVIIINILFIPQYKNKAKIINYKLLITLESAVYRFKCREKKRKVK